MLTLISYFTHLYSAPTAQHPKQWQSECTNNISLSCTLYVQYTYCATSRTLRGDYLGESGPGIKTGSCNTLTAMRL